jgi:prepilin-type N-terminal cleavage/methylation domain-containing protein
MTTTQDRDETGFSLIELVVTTSILGVVLLTLLGALSSFTDRTNQTQERALELSSARSAVEFVTRDLRAANPIAATTDISTYPTSVSFSVYCSTAGVGTCGSDNLRPVAYTVSSNQLVQTLGSATTSTTTTRTLLGPSAKATLASTSRQGAIVNTASQPVFQYYKREGTLLDTDNSDGNATTPVKIRDCAQYVEIHLVVVAQNGKPNDRINLVTRADLRNFNEVTGC